ncbi:hypothetical protein [Bermanella sp. R86510]|uniref:hypothetical protein n=1 Tax=unclassified Bermanella TaxID=2627862 RepID=UPI0037C6170D
MIKVPLLLLAILLSVISNQSYARALEVKSIVVEYRENSKRGTVRIPNCSGCNHKVYNFDDSIIVRKNRQPSTIKQLANEYWDANFFTVFVKSNTNQITAIDY